VRFLADENFPADAVRLLRDVGFNVAVVLPGAPDQSVLASAVSEKRILLTFDKDFGEFAVAHRLPASCGVILFRLPPTNPRSLRNEQILAIVASRRDWAGQFCVVEPGRVRTRPLPP